MEKDHPLRKVLELIDFTSLCKDLHGCYCENNDAPGLEIERAPYIGIAKVEFHQTLDAFVQNCKRLIKIGCKIRIT